jgi:hypothetical protein
MLVTPMTRLAALVAVMTAGCGHSAPPAASTNPASPVMPSPVLAAAGAGAQLPQSLVSYMEERGWGRMHLEWHTERRWDRLPPAALAYAEHQGWTRAQHQEGEAGNGLEFLAMHRGMLQLLAEHDRSARPYLVGWTTPPTDPHDLADPLPHGASTVFEPDMLAAVDRLQHHLDSFASEDELGLYIETAFRPTGEQRDAKATDRSAGIHNYLHNRFQDPSSPIDLGNPAVNLLSARFWRLHGWIDHLWAEYRTRAGLQDSDPAYQASIRAARAMMSMQMKAMREPPPRELIDAVRP